MISSSLLALALSFLALGQPPSKSWLDRPAYDWNRGLSSLPYPDKSYEHDVKCNSFAKRPTTRGESLIVARGWKIFESETIGRMRLVTAASAITYQCRAMGYQVIVLWDDQFLGTLSPILMDSRADSSIAKWDASDVSVSVRFVRFSAEDPNCCPSRFQIVKFELVDGAKPQLLLRNKAQPRGE